jgi:hypothetical protein
MSIREVMIFSIKAQVYILDQASQSWSPHTFSVVPVSFYTDQTTGLTRIIAMEDSEPKVNSLMLMDMIFHKPSETFGQWLDPTVNELYGLNFTSKTDADNFESTFNEAVAKSTLSDVPSETSTPATASVTQAPSGGADSADTERLRREVADLRRVLAEKDAEGQKKINAPLSQAGGQGNSNAKVDQLTDQLKKIQIENENLQSQITALKSLAGAAGDLEVKLKASQAEAEKLKGSLKASSANVGDWRNQLAALQKENQDVKSKIQKIIELQKGLASVLN